VLVALSTVYVAWLAINSCSAVRAGS
jgi:hypothetical protein